MRDCRPPHFLGRRERESIGRQPTCFIQVAGYAGILRQGGATYNDKSGSNHTIRAAFLSSIFVELTERSQSLPQPVRASKATAIHAK